MEELALNETECPVCLDNMAFSIILCVRGHNICGACRKDLKKCPLCQGTFSSHNRALEEVAVKIDALRKNTLQNDSSNSAFDILDKYKTKNIISEAIGKIVINELKCKVCENYSFMPIFFCTNGHSTCQKCDKCTKCGGAKTDGRNYALEKIAKRLEYHCPYKKFGCSFILTMEQVMHETTCEYKPLHCPLSDIEITKCAWFGTCEDLKTHLVSSHVACKVCETSTLTVQFNYNSNVVIFTMGKIFLITVAIRNDAILYRLDLVGSENDVYKYKCTHTFQFDGLVLPGFLISPSQEWHQFTGEKIMHSKAFLTVSITRG